MISTPVTIIIFLSKCLREVAPYIMFVPGPLKCGTKVEGTVLFIDFQNNCVELTLCHGIMKRINAVQGRFTIMTSLESASTFSCL
jgi:hypothetical protein